jgi:Spy/CpxP family protein refolding chaperone
MTRKLTTFFAAAAILGGLTTVATAFAEESRPSSQPPGAQGMMGDHGGMMGMMGQMSTDQMRQMTRMVDNCNRIMESMNNTPTGPDHRPAPDTHE